MKFFYTIIFVLFFFTSTAQSEKNYISGQYNDLSLTEFINRIESQTSYHFFYNKKNTDSVKVNVNIKKVDITKVMEDILMGTGLNFSIDKFNRAFITKGLKIFTNLPTHFFDEDESSTADSIEGISVEYNHGITKKKQKASVSRLYEVGLRSSNIKMDAILSGVVKNFKTGEPIINASVFINSKYNTTTDTYGYYTLSIPPGRHTLNIMAIGMRETHLQLMVYGDGKMNVDIEEQVMTLKEVIVSAQKSTNVMNVKMGVEKLNIETIRRLPTPFGETDVLRAITTLPGVKTVGEASTGFNVRGGSADQNLILFNDATIYNPAHFFGMFSAFNPELIKDIELYKSSVPAQYGGRLASVLDINTREGNKKKITGSAGIGLITSRVHLEGPIKEDKTSFIIGGRTTYANWMLNLLPKEYENSRASFHDLNLGISHMVDSSNNLYFNGYYSADKFSLNSDTSYGYQNINVNLKWRRKYGNKLTAIFLAGLDRYQFNVTSEKNNINAFDLKFNVQQLNLKANFVYYRNRQHSFDFGLGSILYNLEPGTIKPKGTESIVRGMSVEKEKALESAIYLSHRYTPSAKLSFNTGVRYVVYNYLGSQSVNYYTPSLPRNNDNVTERRNFSGGQFIKTFAAPEVRFGLRYAISQNLSVKASYNNMRQYIHMLSNTTAIAPTDIWKLSDPNIRPQKGDQVSVGIYKNLKSNTLEVSLEGYYKRIKNYLDYGPGATLLLNENIEMDVVDSRGKAYGVEFLVKKTAGKLTGWLGYTYSRILLQTTGADGALLVNKGRFYPASYDKPHDITLVGIFRFNHRLSLSINSTYNTGRPITLPIARYNYAGSPRVLYSDRNEYRIPDYLRTDISVNIDGNHKVRQRFHGFWTIGVYNLLGRRNPYSVYFVSENGAINGYKLSIFGSVIPFINYNIKF